MNLLAFLWLVGCVTAVLLAVIFHDEIVPLIEAMTERVKHPQPSSAVRMMEEMHRHWEEEDRMRLHHPGRQPEGSPEVRSGNDHTPLSDLFVGTGEWVVIHGGTFGPFLDPDVAHMWALDAFGPGTFSVVRVETPWTVPYMEKKDPSLADTQAQMRRYSAQGQE